ncbi:MAG: exodeoxyribonuclease VII small subunit [Planctomycetales bacterium]|nr:exodeoxyribonuclease VII small subunit [Planctomycetales bacterium]
MAAKKVKVKAKVKSAARSTTAKLSFEDALAQLEELVGKLEGGRLGLAESLEAYQQGVARLQQCYQLLEDAELKIAQVSAVDEQGRPRLVDYDDAASDAGEEDLAGKADARSRRRTAAAPQKGTAPGRSTDASQRLF